MLWSMQPRKSHEASCQGLFYGKQKLDFKEKDNNTQTAKQNKKTNKLNVRKIISSVSRNVLPQANESLSAIGS